MALLGKPLASGPPFLPFAAPMPLRLCPMSLGCSHEQSECQSCIPEFHLDMSMYVCSTCSSKRCCRLLALDLLSVAMASKQGAKPKIQAKARPQEAPQQPPPTVIASGSRPGASKPSSEMRPPEPSNPPRKPQQQTPPDQPAAAEPQRQQQSQPGPQQHPAGQTPKAAGQAGLHNQGATAPAAPLQQAWAAGQQASRPTTQAAWPQAVHNQGPCPSAPLLQPGAPGQQASSPTPQAAWPEAVHNQGPSRCKW